ncbi:MAG: transporter, partial [Clostridia bacterium]|nr:transporter [Deltaproteobacteria bacterium]
MIRSAVLILLAGFLHIRTAHACSTCGCGDMTLTVMGSEKPYAGRLRAAVEVRHRTEAVGRENFNRQSLDEERIDAQLIWAPKSSLILMLDVPGLRRNVKYVNLAQRGTTALGEAEVRAKWFVYQDDPFTPSHLLAMTGGLKLPTARIERDSTGELLPIELQAGTGSVDPTLGIAYSYFADPWSFYASASGTWTTNGVEGYRGSRSLRTTTAIQHQITYTMAGRLGFDTRTDSTARED